MHFADYGIIVFYLILMVVIGYQTKNSSANLSDYVRMGNKSTWWMAGFSVFMALFSAITFTGICGQAYSAGWSVLMIFWTNALMFFVQGGIFAPLFRRTRAYTSFDVVKMRFGPAAEQITAYISTFTSFAWGGLYLLSIATFCSAVFGIPVWVLILTIAAVVIFYSVMGGSWSVQITDSLQAIILLPVTIVFAVLCLIKVGGIGGLFEMIDAQGLTEDFKLLKSMGHEYSSGIKMQPGYFTSSWIGAIVMNSLITAFNIQLSSRYLSLKDEKSSRKAANFAGVLMILGSCIWFIPPMVGRLLFHDAIQAVEGLPNKADAAYAITAIKILPPGFVGLIVIAMLAATMSSMDTFLTGIAGQITQNIYIPLMKKLKRPILDDRGLLSLTRRINFLLGLWALTVAFWFYFNGAGGGSIFDHMLQIFALIGPINIPISFSLLIKRMPLWGLFVGMATGIAASTTVFFLERNGIEFLWQEKMFLLNGITLVPVLISTIFYKRESNAFKKLVDDFYAILRKPIVIKDEVGEEMDGSLLNTVGFYVILVGAVIAILNIWGSTLSDHISVSCIALALIAIGLFMRYKGKQFNARRDNQS